MGNGAADADATAAVPEAVALAASAATFGATDAALAAVEVNNPVI